MIIQMTDILFVTVLSQVFLVPSGQCHRLSQVLLIDTEISRRVICMSLSQVMESSKHHLYLDNYHTPVCKDVGVVAT